MSHKESSSSRLSEVRVAFTVPGHLEQRLRELASRDCTTFAGTVRRLLAAGVSREMSDAGQRELAGVR